MVNGLQALPGGGVEVAQDPPRGPGWRGAAAAAAPSAPTAYSPQAAYEEDVRRKPVYDTGDPRKTWADLDDVERSTWIKNPTPRDWT